MATTDSLFPALRQAQADVSSNIRQNLDKGNYAGALGSATLGGALRYGNAALDDFVAGPMRTLNSMSRPTAGAAANFAAGTVGTELSPETQKLFAPSTGPALRTSSNPDSVAPWGGEGRKDSISGVNSAYAPTSLKSSTMVNPDLKDEFSNASIAERNPGGKVTKVVGPDGKVSYSGGNVSGEVSFQDANGNTLRGRPGGGFMSTGGSSGFNPAAEREGMNNAIRAANLRDGVDINRGISSGNSAMDALRAHAMDTDRIGHNSAARLLATLQGDETLRRGQNIQSADNRYGHELTAANNRNRLEYDIRKDQRDFTTQRSDKAFEQGNASDKAQNDMFQQMFRTTVDGKDVPDTAKIARYTVNAQATLPDMVKELQAAGTPEALAKAKDISARGMAALDKSDHARLAQLQSIQDRLEGTHGNVVGSTHTKSTSLMGYRQKAGTNAADGNIQFENGSKAPLKHMAYDEPGNLMLPDWFKKNTDQYTRGMNLRSN